MTLDRASRQPKARDQCAAPANQSASQDVGRWRVRWHQSCQSNRHVQPSCLFPHRPDQDVRSLNLRQAHGQSPPSSRKNINLLSMSQARLPVRKQACRSGRQYQCHNAAGAAGRLKCAGCHRCLKSGQGLANQTRARNRQAALSAGGRREPRHHLI